MSEKPFSPLRQQAGFGGRSGSEQTYSSVSRVEKARAVALRTMHAS
jgi:hypothetical protein